MAKITITIEDEGATGGNPTLSSWSEQFSLPDNPRYWGSRAQRAVQEAAYRVVSGLEKFVDLS